MDSKVKVVVYAETPEAAAVVQSALAAVDTVAVQTRVGATAVDIATVSAGEALPDALILYLQGNASHMLERLAAQTAPHRPPLIVLGAGDDPALVRLAMQAGARDILPLPVNRADLLAAISRVARASSRLGMVTSGRLVAFMPAKGGSGATTIACNTAAAIARSGIGEACLLDLDLQFGDAPLYFDLPMKRDIVDALEEIDAIDATAFSAYLQRHASGLRVLGLSDERPILLRNIGRAPVQAALELALSMHSFVVVDLPRTIDEVTEVAIEMASHVVLVVQQTVPALRDAKRLVAYLTQEAEVPRDRIIVVVNRYDAEAEVQLGDVAAALGSNGLVCIPSDWRLVSACINSGTLVMDQEPNSHVAAALESLWRRLVGQEEHVSSGLLARALKTLGIRAAR